MKLRQDPSMKINNKVRLGLEAYRSRHRLRSLSKAVKSLLEFYKAHRKEAQE